MTGAAFDEDDKARILRYAGERRYLCPSCQRFKWDVWPYPISVFESEDPQYILLQCYGCRKATLLSMDVLDA